MAKKLTAFITKETIRRHARVAAYVVLGISTAVLLTAGYRYVEAPVLVDNTGQGTREAAPSAYVLPAAEPVRLSIPSLDVETTFEEPLGLNEDRTIEVPDSYEQVGYYKFAPTPGELGPAVVLGHVDSFRGPAVFFSLGELEPGDSILIERADGSVAEFEVTGLERYEQAGFPRELVYGDIDHAGLRLVTCSGFFDHGQQKYSHNLVVYAALKEPAGSDESAATTTTP